MLPSGLKFAKDQHYGLLVTEARPTRVLSAFKAESFVFPGRELLKGCPSHCKWGLYTCAWELPLGGRDD